MRVIRKKENRRGNYQCNCKCRCEGSSKIGCLVPDAVWEGAGLNPDSGGRFSSFWGSSRQPCAPQIGRLQWLACDFSPFCRICRFSACRASFHAWRAQPSGYYYSFWLPCLLLTPPWFPLAVLFCARPIAHLAAANPCRISSPPRTSHPPAPLL